ncbi:cytochrome C biogenesis protein [Sphingomonas piscis]|uniref:Cytochrome C biogenesis protein n=1 Tax=Sphingomonas piscis TaxID=2714943 RepID=A0A6G7YSW8_9SPHN|nr:cytochrome C biogenesis protein [Sphingomonas piscis]QIK79824.1 cytochrome C biogenesis protein [Sphingomonas piscis]
MTGYFILLALVAAAGSLLWLLGNRGALLKLSLAALLLGSAGYTLQGRPNLFGAPAKPDTAAPGLSFARARHVFFGEFNASERWLLIADSFSARGKHAEAGGVLANAVKHYPGDLPLWIGFANALVEQGRGMTPPAQLAFARAEAIAPGHPATGFFRGLAQARSGEPQAAVNTWRKLLANAPADAGWRPLVEDAAAAFSAQPAPPRR